MAFQSFMTTTKRARTRKAAKTLAASYTIVKDHINLVSQSPKDKAKIDLKVATTAVMQARKALKIKMVVLEMHKKLKKSETTKAFSKRKLQSCSRE